MTQHIWHLDRFIALTSELTGRTVYANQSPDTYLISPAWNREAVRGVVADWSARMLALPLTRRPPPPLRASVKELGACDSPEAFGRGLDAVLLREFKEKLEKPGVMQSRAFLGQLMLSFWCKGVVAWPRTSQEPFPTVVLSLDNVGADRKLTI